MKVPHTSWIVAFSHLTEQALTDSDIVRHTSSSQQPCHLFLNSFPHSYTWQGEGCTPAPPLTLKRGVGLPQSHFHFAAEDSLASRVQGS
jgi:hypothetical protein